MPFAKVKNWLIVLFLFLNRRYMYRVIVIFGQVQKTLDCLKTILDQQKDKDKVFLTCIIKPSFLWKFKFDSKIWLRTIVPLSVRDGHWSVKFFGTTQFKTESILESITSFMLKCVVESINNSWMKRYKSDPSLNTQSCIKRLWVVWDQIYMVSLFSNC